MGRRVFLRLRETRVTALSLKLPIYEVKISNAMLNLEFFVDESLFGMPQAFQKRMKLNNHPNFNEKIVEPRVYY